MLFYQEFILLTTPVTGGNIISHEATLGNAEARSCLSYLDAQVNQT